MKHIFVIGVGLIGGSIALDLKRLNPEVTVYGMDNNPAHLAEAISLKIIDKNNQNDKIQEFWLLNSAQL